MIIRLQDGSKFNLTAIPPANDAVNILSFSITGEINALDNKFGLGLISNNTIVVEGSEKISTLMTKIVISNSCSAVKEELPKPTQTQESNGNDKDFLDYFVKAENKDEAKVNLKVSLDGSKGTRRYFTNELDFRPFRLHRLGLGGAYDIVPAYFKLRYSSNPSSPIDTIEFGSKITHFKVFNDDGRRVSNWKPHSQYVSGIVTTLNPRIEADWKFKEVNFVFGYKSGVPFNLNQGRSRSLQLTPYVGFELGYTIRSKINNTPGKLIARPLFGADLYFAPYRSEDKTPFVFEAHYIRRFFLKPEGFYVLTSDNKEIPGGTSQRPRDYATAKLTFNYNSIFSPYIEYMYGRKPTKYILVNSRFQVGIQMTFDWTQ